MVDLVATQGGFSYGKRRVRKNMVFSASRQDARVLLALGRARKATAADLTPPALAPKSFSASAGSSVPSTASASPAPISVASEIKQIDDSARAEGQTAAATNTSAQLVDTPATERLKEEGETKAEAANETDADSAKQESDGQAQKSEKATERRSSRAGKDSEKENAGGRGRYQRRDMRSDE